MSQPGPINRRRFLGLGVCTLGAAYLGRRSLAAFAPPLVEFSLVARAQRVQLAGHPASLITYNGLVPSPRLEFRPGDTVRVHFHNQLGEATNLHFHGLHVSPQGHGDNVFLHISPGERFTYEFTLPENHPAGLFYYHPHLHGRVAEQVFRGLGGMLVVRGDIDEIPAVKSAREEFLFLKDFALDNQGEIIPPTPAERMNGQEGSLVTANGQVNPTWTIPQGGLVRLRILNGSRARFYRLALQGHPLYLIATDGRALAKPVELQELLLAPAQRAEVLIQGNQPAGNYRLMDLPYDRGGMMTRPQAAPILIATLSYRGSVPPLSLPTELIPVSPVPEPTRVRQIKFSMGMGGMGTMDGMGGMNSMMGMNGGSPMRFLINDRTFDPNRVDALVKLGTVEEWELMNVDPDHMDHVFHIHTNQFQITHRNGVPEPYLAWRDIALMRGGETVRIRIPFRDFPGRTVYHCHTLDHEDLGMMGVVEMKA